MTKSEKGHPCSFTILRGQVNYIEGLNDKEKMKFIGLIENLKTHEMKKKIERRRHPKRRRLLPSNLLPPSSSKKKMTLKM